MQSNSQTQQDLDYLDQAFRLAQKGQYTSSPNPCVGCVLVNDGVLIGEGFHQFSGEAHAEVMAINNALARQQSTLGATAYVTLEPCNHHGRTPPCSEALIGAGIKRVVIALTDVDERTAGLGIVKLRDSGVQVDTQLAQGSEVEQKVRHLCRGYLSRNEKKRPHVRLKVATSLDGKVALHNGLSQWITGDEARQDGHLLRLQADAILTTSHTIKADNPSFNVRLSSEQRGRLELDGFKVPRSQPILIVLNSDLSLNLHEQLNILQIEREVWIFYSQQLEEARVVTFVKSVEALKQSGKIKADIKVISTGSYVEKDISQARRFLDLSQLLLYLGESQINDLLIEAGSTLNGSLIEVNQENYAVDIEDFYPLVDECVYYLNSKIMGTQAIDAFGTEVISRMQDIYSLKISEVQRLSESDIKLTLSW